MEERELHERGHCTEQVGRFPMTNFHIATFVGSCCAKLIVGDSLHMDEFGGLISVK